MCISAGNKVRRSQNYDSQAPFTVTGEPIKQYYNMEITGFEKQQSYSSDTERLIEIKAFDSSDK